MRKENSSASINDRILQSECPMQIAMSKINGKWKIIILAYISENENRFSLLKKRIPSITDKMLSQQLRELENDGLISREIYPEIPPKVEYSLTENAESLIPALKKIFEWGLQQKEKSS
ncbi:transcriptional regulator [Pedobacter sp. HMWF019]|uniref:winged helix-turn-helix transcriptional regulator n=1 Tax=Pedobacter sp. HMWF019 TaxID=2056856 RepID=UPI000D343773|nr:helix-turn-helix domain-containing protein [Pedobacter sp. HMWF019]PTS91479.1 transcriptional regulator [Pedobacter sp. HMWF019]